VAASCATQRARIGENTAELASTAGLEAFPDVLGCLAQGSSGELGKNVKVEQRPGL